MGLDVNVESLVYHEDDRADAASLLDQHGWHVQAVDSRDEAARLGRAVPDDLAEQTASTTLLIGRR
ncbi:Putative S-adenosyl-L-methionine-dependent methyltransferase [Mycobacterium talmoniae]|uniref:S-adenosyl-L-methionine-dependent methyltransferase n=1 Tax=Mycobacterium talmoniae TaxID=1858794 RepID=A0A2S8BHC5_9MYCO|nr:Putative S-adenosyl-L-methionine-dependent methyltransferase [Mycobacterium talmoniae]